MITLSLALVVILFIVIIVMTAALLLRVYGAFLTPVPFVGVGAHTLDPIIDALTLSDDAVLYDLGAGDGRVLRHALKRNPGMTAIGIEIAPLPRIVSKIKDSVSGAKVDMRNADFFAADLSGATHVFLYLFPEVMAKLEPKLERELRPGTRVVSCDFAFAEKKPDRVIALPGSHPLGKRILVYTF